MVATPIELRSTQPTRRPISKEKGRPLRTCTDGNSSGPEKLARVGNRKLGSVVVGPSPGEVGVTPRSEITPSSAPIENPEWPSVSAGVRLIEVSAAPISLAKALKLALAL